MISIPKSLDVTVRVNPVSHCMGSRENLTCFRCGGAHHFKSECNTWRTRICSRWKSGVCMDPFCAFAHGEKELRTPWRPVCIQVVRMETGKIAMHGCGKQGHTYFHCPERQCLPCDRSVT